MRFVPSFKEKSRCLSNMLKIEEVLEEFFKRVILKDCIEIDKTNEIECESNKHSYIHDAMMQILWAATVCKELTKRKCTVIYANGWF